MSDYIVASSREWHRPAFERFAQSAAGLWRYVDSGEALATALASASPRYIFFLHWSWLVPVELLEKHECVCFHMTDVPYGRGGSPLQNLIAAGKTKTVVSALRMERELDAGPVYAKRPMSLDGRAEEIYLRAGELCWEMIREIVASEPTPQPQQGEATVFRRRKPEQSVLPSDGTLAKLYDHIRMLDAPGYPLAFIQHGDFRLEFSHAELKDGEVQTRVIFRKT
jgi:methionyl-tRNA formyltransferase